MEPITQPTKREPGETTFNGGTKRRRKRKADLSTGNVKKVVKAK